MFNLGAEKELTATLEEIESINPHTPLKLLLNSLRLERRKVQYPSWDLTTPIKEYNVA